MKVLIVGLLPFDSGKTSLALSLITEALSRGMDLGVTKPITAFSGWYHCSSIMRSMEFGKLIGEDIYRLHVKAESGDPIELESPVVFMHMPPDPERVDWQSTFYTALNLNEQIIALRITNPSDTNHYYVSDNLGRLTKAMRNLASKLIESLKPSPKEIEDIDSILLNVGELADECVELISSMHEFTIIESYNNASAPTRSSLKADIVLLVAPSKVAIYSGERYRKAVEVLLKPPWSISSEEVASLLKPIKTVEIKPAVDKSGAWAEGLLDEIMRTAGDL